MSCLQILQETVFITGTMSYKALNFSTNKINKCLHNLIIFYIIKQSYSDSQTVSDPTRVSKFWVLFKRNKFINLHHLTS